MNRRFDSRSLVFFRKVTHHPEKSEALNGTPFILSWLDATDFCCLQHRRKSTISKDNLKLVPLSDLATTHFLKTIVVAAVAGSVLVDNATANGTLRGHQNRQVDSSSSAAAAEEIKLELEEGEPDTYGKTKTTCHFGYCYTYDL